jgi:predicted regulator of Ras-like GTPase activity (Roadblock/LC7/MglB family)
MSKADLLASALDELLANSPEVEAAAVVSVDGLPMASALPDHIEEERLAAMSAALLTLGERAAAGLGRGDLGQVFVEGRDGHVVLMAAGEHAVLVAVIQRGAKIGLVVFEMRRSAATIEAVMSDLSLRVPAPSDHLSTVRAPEPVPAAEHPSVSAWH